MHPRRPRLKAWALKLTLCLLAGAVVTWGVAWGCALWAELGAFDYRFIEGDAIHAHARKIGLRPEDLGIRLLERESASGFGYSFARTTPGIIIEFGVHGRKDDLFRATSEPQTLEGEAGWPCVALRSLDVLGPAGIRWGLEPPGFLVLNKSGWIRLLPTRLAPLGFTLDTLIYGGSALGLLEVAVFARRRRRAKGRCPSCGYDRGGLAKDAACPECGVRLCLHRGGGARWLPGVGRHPW